MTTETTATTARTAPATRTVAGYDLKITAFLPVNMGDVDAQLAAAQAVKAALNGEPGALASLLGMARNIEVGQKFAHRRVPVEPAQPSTDAGQGGETAPEPTPDGGETPELLAAMGEGDGEGQPEHEEEPQAEPEPEYEPGAHEEEPEPEPQSEEEPATSGGRRRR